MKKFLIGLVIEAVFDALLKTLSKMANRSNSKVDDKIVSLIKKERPDIIKELLANV